MQGEVKQVSVMCCNKYLKRALPMEEFYFGFTRSLLHFRKCVTFFHLQPVIIAWVLEKRCSWNTFLRFSCLVSTMQYCNNIKKNTFWSLPVCIFNRTIVSVYDLVYYLSLLHYGPMANVSWIPKQLFLYIQSLRFVLERESIIRFLAVTQ